MNTEERAHYESVIKEEVAKQMEGEKPQHPLRNELYSAGGGVVGGGLGLASINAIHTIKEQSALRNEAELTKQRDAWVKMKDIHDGRATWDSVHPGAQPALKEMYTQHADILNDDDAYRAILKQIGPRTVHRIAPDTKMNVFKRALPNAAIIDNLGQNIKHPAVAAGALAGMTGGYYLGRWTEK